ncbi:unnamed protein product [Nesidiocoris tenuis]|uniref:Mos1 transposase HTH domain-containing protein n=1 Tax=Nesidiocoris tenuis TaxID=355587 RepID=A0A6H5FXS0_9HEMI|nr:unnamed protein product [Nesidiocoris tenuis]
MEMPLNPVSKPELRSVIRFLTAKNESAINIHRELVSVYGEDSSKAVEIQAGSEEAAEEGEMGVPEPPIGRPLAAYPLPAGRPEGRPRFRLRTFPLVLTVLCLSADWAH